MRPLPPALLPLQLWARTHLFKNFIIIFLFYFLLYSASPGSPAAQPRLSAVCSLQPGAGSGGTTGAGLVPALPGWGWGCRPPEEPGPGRLGRRARQNKRGRGPPQHSVPPPPPPQRAGERSLGGARAGGGTGCGEMGGGRAWAWGKRGKSKSAMMPAPTPLRAVNASGVVGIRSQRVNHNHPLLSVPVSR